jgi:hypothetical protein
MIDRLEPREGRADLGRAIARNELLQWEKLLKYVGDLALTAQINGTVKIPEKATDLHMLLTKSWQLRELSTKRNDNLGGALEETIATRLITRKTRNTRATFQGLEIRTKTAQSSVIARLSSPHIRTNQQEIDSALSWALNRTPQRTPYSSERGIVIAQFTGGLTPSLEEDILRGPEGFLKSGDVVRLERVRVVDHAGMNYRIISQGPQQA